MTVFVRCWNLDIMRRDEIKFQEGRERNQEQGRDRERTRAV